MTRGDIIKRLHEVREEHHREEEHLTAQECIARRRKEVDAVMKQYGINLRRYSKKYPAAS